MALGLDLTDVRKPAPAGRPGLGLDLTPARAPSGPGLGLDIPRAAPIEVNDPGKNLTDTFIDTAATEKLGLKTPLRQPPTFKDSLKEVLPSFKKGESGLDRVVNVAKTAALPLSVPLTAASVAVQKIPGVTKALDLASRGAGGAVEAISTGDIQKGAESIRRGTPLAPAAANAVARATLQNPSENRDLESFEDPTVFGQFVARLPSAIAETFAEFISPDQIPVVGAATGMAKAGVAFPSAVSKALIGEARKAAETKMKIAGYDQATIREFGDRVSAAANSNPIPLKKAYKIFKSVKDSDVKPPERTPLPASPEVPPATPGAVRPTPPAVQPPSISPESMPDANTAAAIARRFGDQAPFYVPGVGPETGSMRLAVVSDKLSKAFGVTGYQVTEAMTRAAKIFQNSVTNGVSPDHAIRVANAQFWTAMPTQHAIENIGIFKDNPDMLPKVVEALKMGDVTMSQTFIEALASADPEFGGVLPAIAQNIQARQLTEQPETAVAVPEQAPAAVEAEPSPEELQKIRDEVFSGEAGQRLTVRGPGELGEGTGYRENIIRQASTFPEYFKDQGLTKAAVLNILDKKMSGQPITEKQAKVLTHLVRERRFLESESTARLDKEKLNETPAVTVGELPLKEGDQFQFVEAGEVHDAKVEEVKPSGDIRIKDDPSRTLDVFDQLKVIESEKIGAKEAGRLLFRGDNTTEIRINNSGEVDLSVDKSAAEEFSKKYGKDGIVNEVFLDKTAKVLDARDYLNIIGKDVFSEDDIIAYAKQNGFDAIDFSTLGRKGFLSQGEIKVFNPDLLKAKGKIIGHGSTEATPQGGESFKLDQPEPVRTSPIKPAQEQYIMPGTPGASMPPVSTGTKARQIDNNNLLDDFKPDDAPSLNFGGGSRGAMASPSKPPSESTDTTSAPKPPTTNVVWPGAPNDFQPHIEFPELFRLAKELMGNEPVVASLRKALGRFTPDLLNPSIKLKKDIFRDPVEATKVLAHEIGHLIDWLPDYTLSRGNILGRLKTLRHYLSSTISALPSESGIDARLEAKDRQRIRFQAIKEALGEMGKTLKDYFASKDVRKEVSARVKELYPERIKEAIRAQGLVTKEEITEELKAVTTYWSPFEPGNDDYTKYRFGSDELYAQAVSMLFNQPAKLQEMAPKFYKMFWDHIDRKPEVKDALLSLQEFLAGGEEQILTRRQKDIRNMFSRGEDIWRQKLEEKKAKDRSLWFRLKDELIDKNSAIIEKVKEARATGKLNPEDDPQYYLEEYNYLGGKIHNLVSEVEKEVLRPLERFKITQEDVGEYLFLRRVTTERKDIANPLGQNRDTAARQLNFLMGKFSEIQKKEMDMAIAKLDAIGKRLNKEAFDAGLYKQEIYDKIVTNDAYATFQVLDYLNDYVTSAVLKQEGTLKEIANPFTSTVMKAISVKRAIEREKTRKSVVKFLQEFHPGDIKESEYRWIGNGREIREKEGFGVIQIHDAGTMKGYYVDPYIASSVNYQPQEFHSAVGGIIRAINSGYFRPIYINLNLGFQSFNLLRDFQRLWKTTPGASFGSILKAYYKAYPAAASRVWGVDPDKVIKDMNESGMLSVTMNDLLSGESTANTQLERIMEKYDVLARQKQSDNIFKNFIDRIEEVGNLIETLPKVVGYRLREGAPITPKELSHEVRVYSGSPDFTRKGRAYGWYNNFFLFANAIKEGTRGDYEAAFKNPRTRSGYWYKTAAKDLLPKLLMYLAGAGYFGKKLKDNFDKQTEYDKTNYTTIPMGETDDGQAVYFRVPQDETGRLIGSIFWKMLNRKGGIGNAAKDITSIMGGQVPSMAPGIEILYATASYLQGQNPYDFFRSRPILTDQEQKVRGIYGAKKMGKWYMDKFGLPSNWQYQGKPNEPTVVKALRWTPILSRFIKVTDYGKTEQQKSLKAKIQERMAERSLRKRDMKREMGFR